MKRFKGQLEVLAVLLLVGLFGYASAQGLAGLDDATKLLKDIFKWGRNFILLIAVLYFLWLVGNAFLDRKSWTDVLVGIGYCILGGGSAILAEWAVGLYGGSI